MNPKNFHSPISGYGELKNRENKEKEREVRDFNLAEMRGEKPAVREQLIPVPHEVFQKRKSGN